MCMGGCTGKSSGKSSGRSQMPKNWGGMNTKSSRGRSSGVSKSGSGGSNFGTPKVRASFGSRGR